MRNVNAAAFLEGHNRNNQNSKDEYNIAMHPLIIAIRLLILLEGLFVVVGWHVQVDFDPPILSSESSKTVVGGSRVGQRFCELRAHLLRCCEGV